VKIALAIIGTLAGIAVIVAVIGLSLPVKHEISREITLAAAPDAIYQTITDVAAFPNWRSNVKSVDIVRRNDPVTFRENGSDGSILFTIDESTRPSRVVMRIADRELPFGGSWTYELSPVKDGTTLRITERGEVYNVFFRFASRFIIGHQATIDTYLQDISTRFSAGTPEATS